jgi:PAS domain S-box-containing protein
MPLYEFVLRREGFADELRLTDHAGVTVGDALLLGHHHCIVTSIGEKSTNSLVTERVICELATATQSLPRVNPRLQQTLLQQALLGEALDGFEAAAFVFDATGVLQVVNQAALTMTGYSWSELMALNSAELLPKPADGPGRVAEVVDGSLRSGTGSIRRKNGTMLTVKFSVDCTTIAAAGRYYLSLCWPSNPVAAV